MNAAILYIDLSRPFSEYEKYLPSVSPERREKIARLMLEKDKTVSLVTELFIRRQISRRLGIPFSEIAFGYGEHGKPYILNDKEYFFSASHSDNCIAFAGERFPVGIDVERVSRRNMRLAERFFAAGEREVIEKSGQPEEEFYRIWTSKEAYLKMLGTGLSKPLRSFDVTDKSLAPLFETKRLPRFMLTVCALCAENISAGGIDVTETDGEELLAECLDLLDGAG